MSDVVMATQADVVRTLKPRRPEVENGWRLWRSVLEFDCPPEVLCDYLEEHGLTIPDIYDPVEGPYLAAAFWKDERAREVNDRFKELRDQQRGDCTPASVPKQVRAKKRKTKTR